MLAVLQPLGAQVHEAWVARYDGIGGDDLISGMVLDQEGNIYVTGWSEAGRIIGTQYTTIKYNAQGQAAWIRYYNSPYINGVEDALGIAVDQAGNVCVTGWSNDARGFADIVTVKYDTNGNQQWVARYNGATNDHDVGKAIAVDQQGNVYVTGYSWGGEEVAYDYITIKYGPNGNER